MRFVALVAVAMIVGCSPKEAAQGGAPATSVQAATQSSNPDVESLRRIFSEGSSGFAGLRGDPLSNTTYSAHRWRVSISPYGMHCLIVEIVATASERTTYQLNCNLRDFSGDQPSTAPQQTQLTAEQVRALFERIKSDWRVAAPDLSWNDWTWSATQPPEFVGRMSQAKEPAIFVQLYPGENSDVGMSVAELGLAQQTAQIGANAVKVVCSIRFCTNNYYPDRCSTSTRHYAFDLDANRMSFPDGHTGTIQQTENTISWTDYYEYLGQPVSDVGFTLDRSTLEMRADTPGTTTGRCTRDQRQF
ncbi:MAG: hypothetical protein ABUL73_00750 [Alphaproteobacteria bacterium]